MVKFILGGFTALACVALTALTFAYPLPGEAQKTKEPTVKDLYVANCQMCHGPDGNGLIPETGFVGRKWKTKTTAAAAKIIRQGVPGTAMLPFEGRLTKEQVQALASYVRGLDTPAARKKKDQGQAPSVKVPVPAP